MPTFTEPSVWHYLLCSEATGYYRLDDGSEAPRADDRACWTLLPDHGDGVVRLSHSVSVCELACEACPGAPLPRRPGEVGRRLLVGGEVWLLVRGPADLPSSSLAQLRLEGWTVLPSLVHPDSVAHMKQAFSATQAERSRTEELGARVMIENIINISACTAHAAVHPTALWLLESYIEGPIHLGHSPICAVQKPEPPLPKDMDPDAKSLGGWHSDYPLNGAFQRGGNNRFPADTCLGCEFLTCVDAYTKTNGATWIVPKSRDQNRPPPPSAQAEHPAGAEQLIAPAGSVLIFDIRTWHKSDWNRGQTDRCAILNNVLPQWVMPMMDQSAEYTQFIQGAQQSDSGEVAGVGSLTPREREDAAMVLQNILQGKPIQTFERGGSGGQEQEKEQIKAETVAKL